MATMYRLLTSQELAAATDRIVAWHGAERRWVSPGAVQGSLRRLLEDSRLGHCWQVEIGDRPVGYLLLTFSRGTGGEPRGYVSALYLEPAARGQGHGARAARFLDEVGSWLRIPVHRFGTDTEDKHSSLFTRGAGAPAYSSLRISA